MPTADRSSSTLVRLRAVVSAMALLASAVLMPACAWESASGPGSGVSRQEVDARLAQLVGELPRPTVGPAEEESGDPAQEGADSPAAEGEPPAGQEGESAEQGWPDPAPPTARAPYAVRVEVDRIAHEHRDHVGAQFASAVLAFESTDYETARARVDRVLVLDSGHVGARILGARIGVHFGNLDRAERLIAEGLTRRPDSSLLHETAAWIAQLQGDFSTAREALDTAERLGAPLARIWYNRGMLAEAQEDSRAAVFAWETCLEHDPRHAGAQRRLRALGLEPARR